MYTTFKFLLVPSVIPFASSSLQRVIRPSACFFGALAENYRRVDLLKMKIDLFCDV